VGLANRRYCELVDCVDLAGRTFEEAFSCLCGSGGTDEIARVFATGAPYQVEELVLTRLDADGAKPNGSR